MSDHVLTLNAGSSSIKYSLVQSGELPLTTLAIGEVEGLGGKPRLLSRRGGQNESAIRELAPPEGRDHEAALATILQELRRDFPEAPIAAIGHRVVHGGPNFGRPVRIDDPILEKLTALESWAPLHQPHNLAGIRAARAAFPEAPQVACFDTAFHHGHDFVCDTFALPRALYDEGVRRYGFHGISYEYVSRRFAEVAPEVASGRVIIAHLGNGASMCALRGGRSVASTMGFSTLDGLPMGTRSGQIDPGVLLYLMQTRGHDAESLTDLLYKRSGLKGLSELSNDMRDLEASSSKGAREAIDYFVHRIRYELGGLAATLGGLDAVVFCGGIGENSALIRREALADMDWLGVGVDEASNLAHATEISRSAARVRVFVVPTNEELRIAELTVEVGLAVTLGARR